MSTKEARERFKRAHPEGRKAYARNKRKQWLFKQRAKGNPGINLIK